MKKIFQQYTPNIMTFISMGCGLVSIIMSGQEMLLAAGSLIIASVVLDSLDGSVARKMKVSSGFGKELDSLADVVSFGVAPVIIVLEHLRLRADYFYWILPLLIFYLWAGAFRLARYNLDPIPKENNESIGLTITQAGFMLALAVLSDLIRPDQSLPIIVYALILMVLGYMMTSRIKFPAYSWFTPSKWLILIYLIIAVVLIFFTSFFRTFLIFWLGVLAASICRHIFLSSRLSAGIILNE